MTERMRHMRAFGVGAWLSVALLATMISCTSGPPRALILRDDHAGLARWYEQEAAKLRYNAAAMHRMMEEYSKPTCVPSPKQIKEDLIAHCQLFIKLYTEAAREADTLAHLHRDLQRGAP